MESTCLPSELEGLIRALQNVDDQDWTEQIESMRNAFSAAAAGIGVRYFDYHIVQFASLSSAAPFSCGISTYPESWTQRYDAKGYAHDDPGAAVVAFR